jgi:hypothetical protein
MQQGALNAVNDRWVQPGLVRYPPQRDGLVRNPTEPCADACQARRKLCEGPSPLENRAQDSILNPDVQASTSVSLPTEEIGHREQLAARCSDET